MSYKHVYVPVCANCGTEGKYDFEKRIPEQWAGFIQSGSSELTYRYGKDGWTSKDGSSKSTSSSCYIPEDSIFCSYSCFEKFMQEKMNIIKNSMSGLAPAESRATIL